MERFGMLPAAMQARKVVRVGAFFSCAFLFVLLTLMVSPVSYKKDSASAATNVAKQSSTTLTLSSTNNQATVDLDINNPNGVFAKSDEEGTAEFGVITNNAAGYILSIAASDDNGKLTNGDYNVPVSIASLEQAVTESVFDTSANNNRWGFKPNKYVDANDEVVDNTGENAKYLPSPTTTATVLDKTDTSNTESNDYSIELGVRANYSTPAGTYTNTFNLVATGNPTPYVIDYDKNTEDTVTNMPLSTAAAASEEYVTISSNIPARSNYQFIGWCTVVPEENEGGADSCEGEDANIVLAGGKIGIDRTSETNVTTLYALWQADSVWQSTSPDGKYYIQDVTDATCPSVPTVVYDKRDNKPYYIQKIKTGNNEYCWMTTNLDIAGGTVLDSVTSNIAEGTTYTLPQSSVENFASSSSDSIAGVYNSNNTICGDRPCYSYYNYPAATAGMNPDYNNSTYDICPKGWQLPSAQVFEDLRSTYSSASLLTNAPWNGADSGYFPSNVIQSWAGGASNVYSDYWSSTAYIYSNTLAYILNYSISSSDNTNSVYTMPKAFGMAVRCVAKKTSTPRYIQDVTASTCPNERTLVYDKRDEKPYYIQKLVSDYADLCWMTSDLELAGGTVLDSSTSNIKEGTTYTLPESSSEEFTTAEARVYNTGVADCDGTRPCHSYYNLAAASAGALEPSNWSDNVDYGNTANIDICPKGWSLPSERDTNALYSLLVTHLNNEALDTPPFYASRHKEYSTMVSFENTANVAEYLGKYYWERSNGNTRVSSYYYGYWESNGNITFGTGGSLNLSSPSTEGYAIRCVAKYNTSNNKTYIQDISKDTCPTTPTAVYDNRDGERYTIQKLADGNCWLLDNLRLNKSTLATALTDENTNIKFTTSFELPENIKRNYGNTAEPQVNAGSRIKTASYGAGEGQIGSYYNYCAASAGTICGDEVSSDATEDICPAGWRMPTGGSNGEYQTLVNSYNSFEDAKNALRSPVSGYYYDRSSHHQGSYGSFWSSTYDNNNHFYSLDVRIDSVYPDYNSNRDSGLSVRCVAKERVYLQDITQETCPSIPTRVYDIRDDEVYYIQKLMDGKCWLLDNLRLDAAYLKTTLTPDNTNMSSEVSFTLPSSSSSGFNTNTAAKVSSTYRNTSMSYGLGSSKNGNYYNYCAASAGTICASSNTNDAVYDICPKGWHMPSGGADGDYSSLYAAYNNNVTVLKNALHIVLPGYYYNSSLSNRASSAYLLSSTYGNSTTTMQNLYVGTSSVTLPQSMNRYRYYGASVRCVITGGSYGNIHYEANGGYGNVEDAIGVRFNETTASANTFNNYFGTFKHWNTKADGTGVSVAEGASVGAAVRSMNVGDGETLTLYAIWDEKVVYMQDITPEMCPTDTAVTVYDIRRGQRIAYRIQKLADGRCWMLDELELYIDDPSLFTSETTNIAPNMTFSGSNVSSWDDNADSFDHAYVTSAFGDVDLFNYCAATAGTICGPSNDERAFYDVCPKGWRLPTGGSNGEYEKLYAKYNDYDAFVNAFKASRRGWFNNNWDQNLHALGMYGWYWTSTAQTTTYRSVLEVYYSDSSHYGITADDWRERTNAISIRCVMKQESDPVDFIQNITIETCPTTPTNVLDSRDNTVYTIQKLADGRCWMLENLRLGGSKAITLYSTDTNISPASSFTLPASISSGFDSFTSAQINTGSKTKKLSYGDGSSNKGMAGVYYNYCAASAGTVCTDSPVSNAKQDICPKGWHLPTSGDGGEYQLLYNSYENDSSFKNAFRLPLAGVYSVNSAVSQGSYGYYWSSSVDNYYNLNNMYHLFTSTESVVSNSSYGLSNNRGATIRCVQGEELPDQAIQSISVDTCPTTPTKVYDSRDEEVYSVQKLADGNCWMLENLRLDAATLKTPLSTENTNMSPSVEFSLPTSTKYGFSDEAEAYTTAKTNNRYKNVVDDNTYYVKKGVYYNYCAASAGTVCMQGSASNAEYDICPKGWHMPTGGLAGQYGRLYYAYDSIGEFMDAFRYTSFGAYESSYSFLSEYLWSSTAYSNDVYGLYYSTDSDENVIGDVSAPDAKRYRGYPVRCVASKETEEKTYIQDVTIDSCTTSPKLVYDKRDGEAYVIQRLNDKNCWMLDNLRLDAATLSTALTTENTNMSPDIPFNLNSAASLFNSDYSSSYTSPSISNSNKNNEEKGGRRHTKVGVYYNYCAASAGTYCYYGNKEDRHGDAEYDICPAGWRLPTGGEGGEFDRLRDAYTYNYEMIDAFNIPNTGIFWGNSASSYSSASYLWTSTETTMMYRAMNAFEYSYTIRGDDPTGRYSGVPIRCIIKGYTPVYYQASYSGNGADTGTMDNIHSDIDEGDSISLVASNFSKAGYGFAGWSTDQDAAAKVANGQDIIIYGPNQIVTVDSAFLANEDSNHNITLYAVWLPQDNTYTMQTFGATQCNAMNTNDIVALKDIRDNNVYTVAKLGDGHCWMTENLRINPATANITAANTNGPTQAFLDGLATAADSTTLCNTNGSACDDTIKYNLNDLNRSLTASPTANNNSSSWYSYGGMYNWYTATAGNGLYSRSSGSVTNDGDICPTGWRLPTGGDGGEYQALNTAINSGSTTSSTNLVSFPANIVYSGDYNYNTSGGRGTYTRLWSATATSNANAYRMGVAPAEVTPLKNWNKWDGFAVRCIVK